VAESDWGVEVTSGGGPSYGVIIVGGGAIDLP
jgi:hypothetical protein